MLPWITERTERTSGYLTLPYGNFKDAAEPEAGWTTFDHRPRYLTNYIGLRNRLSILVEMYAYADYEARIRACRAFLRSILEFAFRRGGEMRAVTAAADRATVAAAAPGGEPLRFHTAFRTESLAEPVTVRGYRMEQGIDARGRERLLPVREEPVDYRVPYFGLFVPEGEGTPMPAAYLFPRGLIEIRKDLRRHGIRVREIPDPITLRGEVFHVGKIDFQEDLFQGHRLQRLEGEWREEEVSFPGGACLVPAGQPLFRVAAYLLEPESDDGLACWNFMDRYLTRGDWDPRPGTYPVIRCRDVPPP
jgi:hypothetical protein